MYHTALTRIALESPCEDTGITHFTCIAALQIYGACLETECCYTEADNRTVKFWEINHDATNILHGIHERILVSKMPNEIEGIKVQIDAKNPVLMSFMLHEYAFSNTTTKSGIFIRSGKEVGLHSVLCVGYDDTQRHLIVKNSWGTSWGNKGYGYIPYAYCLEDDNWFITMTANENIITKLGKQPCDKIKEQNIQFI